MTFRIHATVVVLYAIHSSIGWRIGSGRLLKITAERKKLLGDQNIETTVYQLHKLLTSKDNSISLHTILFVN